MPTRTQSQWVTFEVLHQTPGCRSSRSRDGSREQTSLVGHRLFGIFRAGATGNQIPVHRRLFEQGFVATAHHIVSRLGVSTTGFSRSNRSGDTQFASRRCTNGFRYRTSSHERTQSIGDTGTKGSRIVRGVQHGITNIGQHTGQAISTITNGLAGRCTFFAYSGDVEQLLGSIVFDLFGECLSVVSGIECRLGFQ
ncbi:hypothetical protein D3C84_278850 [compost metagenome]